MIGGVVKDLTKTASRFGENRENNICSKLRGAVFLERITTTFSFSLVYL